MEIAKGIQNTVWHNLMLEDPNSNDWDTAVTIFKNRISERYLEPIDALIALEAKMLAYDRKYGFTILSIDCMLVETLQAFREGLIDTKGKSKEMFQDFLTTKDSFKPYFTTPELAIKFYYDYRCGMLHLTETRNKAKVWSVGELLFFSEGGDMIINRTAFHNALKDEFNNYLNTLRSGSVPKLRTNFITKMNFLSQLK